MWYGQCYLESSIQPRLGLWVKVGRRRSVPGNWCFYVLIKITLDFQQFGEVERKVLSPESNKVGERLFLPRALCVFCLSGTRIWW